MTVRVLPADASHLTACFDIWVANEEFERPQGLTEFPLHRHELETGDLRVALDDREVVGFGAVLTRSGVDYLADLFVRPDRHGRGIGRLLLDALFGGRTGPRFTFASSHAGARRLYASFGMAPAWELSTLIATDAAGTATALRDGAPSVLVSARSIELVTAARLDRAVTRRDREVDVRAEAEHNGGTHVGVFRGAALIGTATVVTRRPWDRVRGRARLAPVVVPDPADAVAVCAAALDWAATDARATSAMTFVPAAHPAHSVLVAAGFEVVDTDLLMASEPDLVDAERYFPTTGTA